MSHPTCNCGCFILKRENERAMIPMETLNGARSARSRTGVLTDSVNTEAEEDLLYDQLEEFWSDWCDLVNRHINKCPQHLRADLMERMQDKATVYGAAE